MGNPLRLSKPKGDRWVWTYCPETGEEVVGLNWDKGVVVISSLFGWYYCPSCGGWHVHKTEPEDNNYH